MAGKSKGDDINEKMIRYLLKMPENRRCINCNSLGPQYVCTTFWTFICTNCSGVHREFNHRVKSVSMAKFTDQEVNALHAGGNECARQTYLKTWDSRCNTLPRNSNTNKLREFIKHVYEDRRYTGDITRFSKLTLGAKDDPYSHKFRDKNAISKQSTRHGQSHSKSRSLEAMDERYERLRRREATEMFTTSDLTKDRCRRIEDDSAPSNLPVLRSIQEILGENAPTLRVEKQPQTKRGTSSSTVNASLEKVTSPKKEASNSEVASKHESSNLESLIDLTIQSNKLLDSSGDHEAETVIAPRVPYSNTLEYLLFELGPPIEPSYDAISPLENSSNDNMSSNSNELMFYNQGITSNKPPKNILTPSDIALDPTKNIQGSDPPHDLPSSQQCDNYSLLPTSSTPSVAQPINPSQVANIEIESIVRNDQEHQNKSVKQFTNFAHGENDIVANLSALTQSTFSQQVTQRKEIPFDIFNTTSSSGIREPFPILQNGPYSNMGYSMQYQYQNHVPFMQQPFANPPLSTNPFTMNNNLSQVHSSKYPLMVSTQGTLNNLMINPQSVPSTSFAPQMQGTYTGHTLYNNNTTPRVPMEPLGSIYANEQATFQQFGSTNPSEPPPRAGNPFA